MSDDGYSADTIGDDGKRASVHNRGIAAGGKAIKMARGGAKGAIKGATALPGSAVKGVGTAAKFGVNATTMVAKGATSGAGKAAKVRFVFACFC